MPVKKDDEGRRYVEAEVEVPGSPEEVWRAIATAEGISSWFMPTTAETDADGKPTRARLRVGDVVLQHPPAVSHPFRRAALLGPPVHRLRAGAGAGSVADDHGLLLRLEQPGPGIAYVMAMPMGEHTMVSIRLFLYGDGAEAIAAGAESDWNGWLAERFPQEAST